MLKQMGDKAALHGVLRKAILEGLGLNRQMAWDQVKTLLSRISTSVDEAETRGQDIVDALITGSIEQECSRIIDLCSEYDDGLVLLRNACSQTFRSHKAKRVLESSMQNYAREFVNQPFFDGIYASLASQSHIDLTWIDGLNQTSFAQAKRIVKVMSRPGEPLYDDDKVEQFLYMRSSMDVKSVLKQILGNKSQSVVDLFRRRLYTPQLDDQQSESSQFLYIFVEEATSSESLYRFKAELIEQGTTIPLDFDPDRKNNGAWPEGSIIDLPAYIVHWYDLANRQADVKLSMEIFLPIKLLMECHTFQIIIPTREDKSSPEMLNLIFDCPFVLRSSDRAVSAMKGELGPLIRKWQSLRRGDSVLHYLSDDSEIDQGPFNALLKQDDLAGILMLKNLPDDECMRSRLIKKIIESGTPLLAWFHDIQKNDSIESMDHSCEKLKYLDRCLNLDGVQRDELQRIKAPVHLCDTELAAQKRFNLATQTDCESWIHRVNIFHDHPDRWPQQILYEQQPNGEVRTDIY
jgi:hypothetical protein